MSLKNLVDRLHGTIYITKVGCDWCISIFPLFHYFGECDPLQLCCIFYHGHPCLRNLNSTIPVDVIRVKSYVDSFLDPTSVQVRIAINKLTLSWGETTLSWGETTWGETSFQIVSWACSENGGGWALGTVVSPQSRFPQIKGILSRCSARANLTGFFHRKTMGTVMSCHVDATK